MAHLAFMPVKIRCQSVLRLFVLLSFSVHAFYFFFSKMQSSQLAQLQVLLHVSYLWQSKTRSFSVHVIQMLVQKIVLIRNLVSTSVYRQLMFIPGMGRL